MTAVRLNIGAGDAPIEGFTPIDRKNGQEAWPLGYGDSTVDEIRASHVLEHFGFAEVPKVLADWVRVLKPGGRIRIAVPDFDKIANAVSDPRRLRYAMGGQVDDNDYHRSAFTAQTLIETMRAAGIRDIQSWSSDNGDAASLPISLNLEGIKAEKPADDLIKICAVLSIPRVGWNDHWGCIADGLAPFKIPVRRFIGAFWAQNLQTVLEVCLRDPLDWILVLDYDTMFTAKHLDTMFGIFGQHPEIDALAALQARRNTGMPLATIKGQKGIEVDGKPIKIDTAHFGLTLIRADALRDLPKPWFQSVPGPDGTWTHDEHIDPDIYFWKQWAKAGKTAYLAPDVRIGHLELMVSEFDEQLTHRHVHIGDWREVNGKSKERPL